MSKLNATIKLSLIVLTHSRNLFILEICGYTRILALILIRVDPSLSLSLSLERARALVLRYKFPEISIRDGKKPRR